MSNDKRPDIRAQGDYVLLDVDRDFKFRPPSIEGEYGAMPVRCGTVLSVGENVNRKKPAEHEYDAHPARLMQYFIHLDVGDQVWYIAGVNAASIRVATSTLVFVHKNNIVGALPLADSFGDEEDGKANQV